MSCQVSFCLRKQFQVDLLTYELLSSTTHPKPECFHPEKILTTFHVHFWIMCYSYAQKQMIHVSNGHKLMTKLDHVISRNILSTVLKQLRISWD